jgi:hypothetical protein
MNGDPAPSSSGDIEQRTRIVNAVASGDLDAALSETERHYPAVLAQEEGLMMFKLRCRKFVELILEAAELKKRMGRLGVAEGGAAGAGAGAGADDGLGDMELVDMDVDDDASSMVVVNGFGEKAKWSSSSPLLSAAPVTTMAQYENALNKAIRYGQLLQTDYKADGRAEVQGLFRKTFGIVAYEDPMDAGEEVVADVVGTEARVRLANELNQAILSAALLCVLLVLQC